MYAYAEKLKAVKLYLKYESYAAVINELGYPSRMALRDWIEAYRTDVDVQKEMTRTPKYTEEQKQAAVTHYLEHGKCYSRTCRKLGYPSRGLLTEWVMERAPQPRQLIKKGVNLTQQEKEAAVLALVTRTTSAQSIADQLGVSRNSLYNYKERWLGKDVLGMVNDSKETDVNQLKSQVKQLQEEVHRLQIQKDVLEKAGELLKKDQGIHLEELTNQEKTLLIDALRPFYPLKELLACVSIPKSSYSYHHTQLSLPDKYCKARTMIIEIFHKNKRRYGYRRIHTALKHKGMTLSEKIVQRIMREEILFAKSVKIKKYSSYKGEISPAVPNILERDFTASKPNTKWVTDLTEFRLPAGKVYLSPMIGCFDSAIVSWTIGASPNAELTNSMLDQAVLTLKEGENPIVHSDRGAHYRWPSWIERMESHHLTRSMSKKGCTPDNAACEGFFGRLKNEFFYDENWLDVSIEHFMQLLNNYLHWYNHERIKLSLGGMSIMDFRKTLPLIA